MNNKEYKDLSDKLWQELDGVIYDDKDANTALLITKSLLKSKCSEEFTDVIKSFDEEDLLLSLSSINSERLDGYKKRKEELFEDKEINSDKIK